MGWGTDPVFEQKSTGGWGRDEIAGGVTVESPTDAGQTSHWRDLADSTLSGAIGRGVRGAVDQPYRLATHLLGTGEAADQRLREWDERIRRGQQLTGREGETDLAGMMGGAATALVPAMKVGTALRAAYPVAAKTLPGLLGLPLVEGAVGGAASSVPLPKAGDETAPGYGMQVVEQTGLGSLIGSGLAGAGRLAQAGIRAAQPMIQGLTEKGRALTAYGQLTEGLPPGALEDIRAAMRRNPDAPTAGEAMASRPAAVNIVAAEQRAIRDPSLAPTVSIQRTERAQARMQTLDDMAGTDDDLAAAVARREADTAPLRDQALNAAGKHVDGEGILKTLGRLANDKDLRERQLRKAALEDTITRIEDRMGMKGGLTARDLYGIRQDLGSTIRRLAADTKDSSKAVAMGAELDIQSAIDTAIIKAGGKEWKQYLSTYHRLSAPINEMEAGRALREALVTDLGVGERGNAYAKAVGELQELERGGHGAMQSYNLERAEAIKSQLADMAAYAKMTGQSEADLAAGRVAHGPAMIKQEVSWWNQLANALSKGAQQKMLAEMGPRLTDPRTMEKFLAQAPPSMHPLITDALIRQSGRAAAAGMGATGASQ